jgi:phage gp36-like protein
LATYSSTDDLLTGQVPVPQAIDPAKYVSDATDEVDSVIGFRYLTPLDLSNTSPIARPARLLIKRIANFIATGRLLMAAAIAGEDRQLQAYAASLLEQGLYCLKEIAEGDITLPGAPTSPDSPVTQTGVLLFNEDAESNVSAFYDRITNPCPVGQQVRIWPGAIL